MRAPYCVLALLLVPLLHREARAVGYVGGPDTLVEPLADLKLVVDLPTAGRWTPGLRVTERTPVQERLVHHFQLAKYHGALSPAEG